MAEGKELQANDVVWVDAEGMTYDNTVIQKLQRLVYESAAMGELREGMRLALKVNTAEEGYEYGLRPIFFRTPAEMVTRATKTRPVICDGLKLVDYWKQSKGNAFMEVARLKGYSNDTLGGHFVINGGFSGDEGNLYALNEVDSMLGGVEVGTAVCRSDALWVLSHVTLHPVFGMSGALLNGGLECLVGRERSRLLDGVDPYPFNGRRSPPRSLLNFQRRAVEGVLGVRAAMEGRVFYLNYLWDVTPEPEYFPYGNEPVVRNLGFMASRDPVALDAATFSILEAGGNPEGPRKDLIGTLTGVDFSEVLRMAEALGAGSTRRKLKRFS